MFLKPFVKELRRDLDRQNVSIQLHRFDRGKPRFERLGADVVLNDLKAFRPDTDVVLVHVVSSKRLTCFKLVVQRHARLKFILHFWNNRIANVQRNFLKKKFLTP